MLDGTVYDEEWLAASLGIQTGWTSETLLSAGYERWGEEMLARLRGDFAFLVWDRHALRGLLARDQLGGRSIFFHATGGILRFATEILPLLELLPSRPAPDSAAVTHWLAASEPGGDGTLWEGVRRMPAGCCMRLENGRFSAAPFWSPAYRSPAPGTRAELVEGIRAGVTRSVARRSVDDGRTGVLLSGGLDSVSVAAAAHDLGRGADGPPGTYSAVFPGLHTVDESALIGNVAGALGLRSTRIAVTGGSMLAGALEHQRNWGVPLIAPNDFFLQPLLAQARRDGVEVMFDGEGGDVLFAAPRYLLADRVRRARVLSAWRLAARLPGAGSRPARGDLARLVREYGFVGSLPPTIERALRRAKNGRAHTAPDWVAASAADLLFDTARDRAWKRLDGPRWWAHRVDALTAGLDALGARDYLRRRAATAGLEARHPLYDLDLMELVMAIPPEASYDPYLSRPLLREAFADRVPDAIRLRPGKSLFDEVIHRCLAGPDRPVVCELIGAPDAEVRRYTNEERLRAEVIDFEPRRDPRRWASAAWRLVTAECWLRSEADPGFADRLLASGRLAAPEYSMDRGDGQPLARLPA